MESTPSCTLFPASSLRSVLDRDPATRQLIANRIGGGKIAPRTCRPTRRETTLHVDDSSSSSAAGSGTISRTPFTSANASRALASAASSLPPASSSALARRIKLNSAAIASGALRSSKNAALASAHQILGGSRQPRRSASRRSKPLGKIADPPDPLQRCLERIRRKD